MTASGTRRGNLVDFHTKHKLLIQSHSPKHAAELGRLVARARELSPGELFESYLTLLMEALHRRATVKKNAAVLQHITGYFRKHLTVDERKEIREIIDLFRQGIVPLIVPVTILNHHVRKYEQPYLLEQVYLNPHPVELKLRNHV